MEKSVAAGGFRPSYSTETGCRSLTLFPLCHVRCRWTVGYLGVGQPLEQSVLESNDDETRYGNVTSHPYNLVSFMAFLLSVFSHRKMDFQQRCWVNSGPSPDPAQPLSDSRAGSSMRELTC